jgi:hypothetical protein
MVRAWTQAIAPRVVVARLVVGCDQVREQELVSSIIETIFRAVRTAIKVDQDPSGQSLLDLKISQLKSTERVVEAAQSLHRSAQASVNEAQNALVTAQQQLPAGTLQAYRRKSNALEPKIRVAARFAAELTRQLSSECSECRFPTRYGSRSMHAEQVGMFLAMSRLLLCDQPCRSENVAARAA